MSTGLTIYTWIHVIISLVGIATGFVVLFQMIGGKRLDVWNTIFLATTVLTSVTGFGFPIVKFTPGLAVGTISLLDLAPALYALYVKHLVGVWGKIYVITAVIAFYFNFFVLIVQSFMKVPALSALAPTQSEPPFAIAQGVALVGFIVAGVLATKNFRAAA